MSPTTQILTDEEMVDLLSNDSFASNYAYSSICKNLNNVVFKLWEPYWPLDDARLSFGLNGIVAGKNISHDEYIENIYYGTATAHRFTGIKHKINAEKLAKRSQELNLLIAHYPAIYNKYKKELYEEAGVKMQKEIKSEEEWRKDRIQKIIDVNDQEDDRYVAPTELDEEKILITMQSDLFADVIKFQEKYAIRIGDGKYFVASDEIKIVLRDPSQRPAWAVWFLSAVPLDKIPEKAALLLMSEEERTKVMPEEIPDHLIICHASLWQMSENKTGILLHTSWNHISATYRWVVDKPIEVASVLFKSVSHPAHLARNFGYMPNLAIPGDKWFR